MDTAHFNGSLRAYYVSNHLIIFQKMCLLDTEQYRAAVCGERRDKCLLPSLLLFAVCACYLFVL